MFPLILTVLNRDYSAPQRASIRGNVPIFFRVSKRAVCNQALRESPGAKGVLSWVMGSILRVSRGYQACPTYNL